MRKLPLILLLLACNGQAEIFKCLDSRGKTVFRDSPCEGGESLTETIDDRELASKTLLIPSGAQPQSANSRELIKNPGFNQQLRHWQQAEYSRWLDGGGTLASGALAIQAPKLDEQKYHGKRIYETVIKQCVPLTTAARYNLSAQFLSRGSAERASANRANIIWYRSEDCSSGGQWGGYLEPRLHLPGWQRLQNKNLRPALGSRAALITLVQNGRYANNSTGLWDNISLTAAAGSAISSAPLPSQDRPSRQGENLIENGSFDRKLSGWRNSSRAEWSRTQGASGPGSALVTLRSNRGGLGTGVLSQCVNLPEHSNFSLGATFKIAPQSTQQGGGRLRLVWHQHKDCRGAARISSKSADPEQKSGWQQLQVEGLEAPEGSASALIEVIQSVTGNGSFTAYWDDIFLRVTP